MSLLDAFRQRQQKVAQAPQNLYGNNDSSGYATGNDLTGATIGHWTNGEMTGSATVNEYNDRDDYQPQPVQHDDYAYAEYYMGGGR
jgi:hypothetical protein